MGKTPAGHVAAGHVHRDDPLPKLHAGGNLGHEVAQALALGLGKGEHLLVGKLNVALYAFGHRIDKLLLLFFA